MVDEKDVIEVNSHTKVSAMCTQQLSYAFYLSKPILNKQKIKLFSVAQFMAKEKMVK